ncbi:MAG: DUF1961 family protein [Methylacidiphilales bacterium]|nr:DUF1961 family protein [Candidatus Methylacidiphilales bacterium]
MSIQPALSYRFGEKPPAANLIQDSSLRIIEHKGRKGIHLPAIRGRFILPEHTVNEPQGSLTMWVLPLQDLYPAPRYPAHAASNPKFSLYTFLSDRENVRDTGPAQFSLCYDAYWHPGLSAKFHGGNDLYWQRRRGAVAAAGHFEMHRLHWYQMTVTWDRPKGIFSVYANGVLVATHDTTYPSPLPSETCGLMLFGGNPALVYSDIAFFNKTLSAAEARGTFRAETTDLDAGLQESLERMYEGKGLKALDWKPDAAWKESLALSLTKKEDMLAFYHQGSLTSTHVTDEGTRVTTPSLDVYYSLDPSKSDLDPAKVDVSRTYLWSRQVFEGDLHASFDFKILKPGGLCLFMAQASGMQGEDFMKDYFLRSDGAMRMVCWEDVRNYHWEFYREMLDVRNDLVSHAVLKNPWFKPVCFQMENRRWEPDRWYRFEFLQEGDRIRGAIDGITVMDVMDNSFDNNGPVLRSGHIAIRCMMRTDMVFRNLRVMNRPDVTIIKA